MERVMGKIFSHTDVDGDEIRVDMSMWGDSALFFRTATPDDQRVNVRLDEAQVRDLQAALDVWLAGCGAPERTPVPSALTEERVREIVAEELGKVRVPAGAGCTCTLADVCPTCLDLDRRMYSTLAGQDKCAGCAHLKTSHHVGGWCTEWIVDGHIRCECTQVQFKSPVQS